eukprot:1518728-Prymnesium_polylepis.1
MTTHSTRTHHRPDSSTRHSPITRLRHTTLVNLPTPRHAPPHHGCPNAGPFEALAAPTPLRALLRRSGTRRLFDADRSACSSLRLPRRCWRLVAVPGIEALGRTRLPAHHVLR